jgi:HD-GYP domain-containing protein (c-di-GMP phosphodiesterase class II)/HAMP domain-containing protein
MARLAALEKEKGRAVTEIGDWVIATRDIFLRFDLGASSWRLVTLKSRQSTLAAASGYTSTAGLLLLTALVLVFVLTHAQIRRSTVPLQQLRDASTRVAEGHLEARIEVRGTDEYAEVGAAFNGMTIALQQQVRLLQGMEAIDRSVLATREINDLVEVTLSELADVHRDGPVALLVRRALTPDVADLWWRNVMDRRRQRAPVTLLAGESTELLTAGLALLIPGKDEGRAYVAQSRGGPRDAPSLVLPLCHADELIGAVILHGAHRGTDEVWTRGVAARLTERVALALANVRLVDRLEVLSVGTLSAFARTIETNSVWSAGHAERVTALAMVLGRRMGVSAAEEDALHRGGLLHDIGKIGIPSAVLDKPSRLDANEAALMRRHPELGERILQPIPAFADVLPIVRSHHERLDGSGYPDGLRGKEIHRLARIVAVADVYDALTFDRPYRAAYAPEDAIAHLVSHPDRFEPEALAALELVARDDLLVGRPLWRDALSPIQSEDVLTALQPR